MYKSVIFHDSEISAGHQQKKTCADSRVEGPPFGEAKKTRFEAARSEIRSLSIWAI